MQRLLYVAAAIAALAAVPPARTLYNDALAREQAVRPALAAPDALATILIDVRAVVKAYEAIVRRYPASGYSDNALWNAGRLSLDAFEKFGQQQDRDAGVRLLNRLAAAYPSSKLAKRVPNELDHLGDSPAAPMAASAPPPVAPPASPAASSAPSASSAAPSAVPSLVPSPTQKIATILAIRRTVLPGTVRITIELDGEVTFHDEHIVDPERVFVDLAGARAASDLVDRTIRFNADDDVVRQVRIGRHPNHTTRVVLDAAGVGSYSVYPLYAPFRLVIDCLRSGRVAPLAPPTVTPVVAPVAAPIVPRQTAPVWHRLLPHSAPRATRAIADAVATIESTPATVPSPVPAAMTTAPTTPVAPPSRNANGGFSIARQLGLGVSRVVIDPGHGGHDPGAKGKGITEADLVLDVSLRLEKLLQKAGMEVILTRRADEFIPLQERPAIANRENADLFLSIHANASANATARGIETYFLNFADNPNEAQVAARENAASALSMGTLPDVVKAIALNNKVDESRDFAGHVQRSLVDRLRAGNKTVKDLGVKQAPFIVLIGATMPSVLAEISFVTNVQDAKLLKGNAYRQRIAEALFNAITGYQTSLRHVATVAHQEVR